MSERVDTIVIGGGQAGLAAGYYLTKKAREHVVLERGRVGETWRSERWDSFRLNTPNFFLQLPGHDFAGEDRDDFLTRDETIAVLEHYAEAFNGTVHTGVDVKSLGAAREGGFRLETSAGPYAASNVVVATGSFRRETPRPTVEGIFQLHSREYRNPEQLPDGAVLVVGSAQSGCQIAAELNRAGRDVYLSLGRCPSLPLIYRGRRIYDWLIDIGLMEETVDMLPSPAARLAGNPTVASEDVDHLVGPRRLADKGVTLVGRLETMEGNRAAIRPDANDRLGESAQFETMIKQRMDAYADASGLDLPEEQADSDDPLKVPETSGLDLRAAGVRTILWANGFRPDYWWIEFPIFDADGWPVQTRGVTEIDGLYFVGAHWLHKRKSALLLGVGEDAEHVVSTIVDGKQAKEER